MAWVKAEATKISAGDLLVRALIVLTWVVAIAGTLLALVHLYQFAPTPPLVP